MHAVALPHATDLDGWRAHARALVAAGVPPQDVTWQVAGAVDDLFAAAGAAAPPPPPPANDAPPLSVPRAFVDLAGQVIRHRDPVRLPLLYRLLWRQVRGEKTLMAVPSDPDVARALTLARQVKRDGYCMKAYLRFREVPQDGAEPHYVGWFEPEHHVVEAVAPHFVTRFKALRWSILTPDRSAHWDGRELTFAEGAAKADVPDEDALVSCWETYYSSIFNPARLKVDAMLAQMPRKYWKNLDEGRLINGMVREAAGRTQAMVTAVPSAPAVKGRVVWERPAAVIPADDTAERLRADIARCRACPLWQPATQAVPGAGPMPARLMLVGEQPGDQEDLSGRPFVGPAGQVLDAALVAAGLDREQLYVTSAVKHFKFEPRGKRRVHQRASSREAAVCGQWLEREVALVKPDLIVALGATAAKALLGREVAVSRERGTVAETAEGRRVLVSVHPAAALRQQDDQAGAAWRRALAEDLAAARAMLGG